MPTSTMNISLPEPMKDFVEAQARGSDGREAPMLALMDSGASESLIPAIVVFRRGWTGLGGLIAAICRSTCDKT